MGFITWLQGRWSVLGIRRTVLESNSETVDETEDDESIQQIMSGAIVRAVIEEAVKGAFVSPIRLKLLTSSYSNACTGAL